MRIALALSIGFALAVAAGCMTDPQDEPETSSVESAITILPLAGTWFYDELTPVSTTCNFTVSHFDGDGPFEVGQITTASFVVTPHDGTAAFTCKATTTGGFSCPLRAQLFRDLRPSGIDAQVTIRATASGAFVDNQHARGKQDAVVSCVGTQCSVVGPNPCGLVVNFTTHM
jgi:hypothetical protein